MSKVGKNEINGNGDKLAKLLYGAPPLPKPRNVPNTFEKYAELLTEEVKLCADLPTVELEARADAAAGELRRRGRI